MPKNKDFVEKSEFINWRLAFEDLQRQVSCGCSGHKFSISDVEVSRGKPSRYRFKCIYCDISYGRNVDNLTDYEKGLVGAMELKCTARS